MAKSETKKRIEDRQRVAAKENPNVAPFVVFMDEGVNILGAQQKRVYDAAKGGDRKAAALIKRLEAEEEVFEPDLHGDEGEETVPAYDES